MVLELNQGPVGGLPPSAGSISTPKVEKTAQSASSADTRPQTAELKISKSAIVITEEPDLDENGQEVIYTIPEQQLQALIQR